MLKSSIWAIFIAFALTMVMCHYAIPFLHRLKFGQQIREEGPKEHQKKAGTPTMGGIMINGDAIKTSAGALHSIAVCKERSLTEAIRFAKNSGLKVVAVAKGAKKSYTAADLTGPLALVF